VFTPSEVAQEQMKKDYMERVWNMKHGELFSELMRVHSESARMLGEAYAELNRVKELLDEKPKPN
jgi:hypothetical protein